MDGMDEMDGMDNSAEGCGMAEGSARGVCGAHAGVEAWMAKIEAKLDRLIEGVLVGNGTPSLKQRIHDAERSIEEARRERERDQEEARRAADRRENRILVAVRIAGPYLASIGSAAAVYLGLKG